MSSFELEDTTAILLDAFGIDLEQHKEEKMEKEDLDFFNRVNNLADSFGQVACSPKAFARTGYPGSLSGGVIRSGSSSSETSSTSSIYSGEIK